jgi:glutathione reductase (NADPH)
MGTTAERYDLVVLGTGQGGSGAAYKCRTGGWRVAIVDDLPYGGTCALRGCDPKKVLVGAAELVDWHRRMAGHGVVGESRIDWPALMRFKRSFTGPIPRKRETAFREAGIATYHGHARFISPHELVVGGETLGAEHVVVATGARPAPLGIPGEEHVRTSTEFLELDELPRRIAFIGAGYISFEFAHVAQRAGATAIVLGRGAPLRRFDQDVVQRLVKHTREIGVDVRVDTPVIEVEAKGGAFRVHVRAPTGDEFIDADLVVHGAGRVPNTEGLDLATGGVATDERGAVRVNDYLQSVSNPRVYAAGDVTLSPAKLPLTPVAAHEGLVVASNLLRGNTRKPDYRGVSNVVFSVPSLASVGVTEAEANAQRRQLRIRTEETGSWYANRRVREGAAMFKTIVDAETDQVIGAHLLGPHADEVVNVFAIAMRHGLTATALRQAIYGYPTGISDIPYML